MARNKYPEKTKALILEKAFLLFKEKGYEHIVMQDIIDETRLSRGAVYHHFKNKKEIMNEVLKMLYENDSVFFQNLLKSNLTATQRIEAIIHFVTTDIHRKELFYGLWIQNNPIVLYSNLQNTLFNASPAIALIIQQGIEEKKWKTEYPEQAAELIMLLLNIWLDPSLHNGGQEQYSKKIDFLLDN